MHFNINYKERASLYQDLSQKLVRHVWDKSISSIVIINFGSSSKFMLISSAYREKSFVWNALSTNI